MPSRRQVLISGFAALAVTVPLVPARADVSGAAAATSANPEIRTRRRETM